MVTALKPSSIRKLEINSSNGSDDRTTSLITPNMEEPASKRTRLSFPMLRHAISTLRDGILDKDSDDKEVESDEIDDQEGLLASSSNGVVDPTNTGFTLLISEQDFRTFIRDNFFCKKCNESINERKIISVRVGCASNVYWDCSNKLCNASASILARQSNKEASGQFKKKRP
jgi:hypothetical protein